MPLPDKIGVNGSKPKPNGPKVATRKGPKIMLRFRTQREIGDVRRAARMKEMSMNTYILTEVLSAARNFITYQG